MIQQSRPTILLSLFLVLFFSMSVSAQGLPEEVLKHTNEFRQSKGLPALEMRDDLNSLAREHSVDMAKGKTGFGHDGFQERRQAAQKFLPAVNGFAENVAYGATSGKEVVGMWKKSSGHRRNMLGTFKYIGIGIATGRDGIVYYTQLFVN